MFTGGKSLPPPPSANRPRNDSLGATLPTYRNRPSGGAAASGPGLNFSSVRSMFESAKPVGSMLVGLARNPAVQNAAITVAKDEKLRSAAISAAQNPRVRNTALNVAASYSNSQNKPSDSASFGSNASSFAQVQNTLSSSGLSVDDIARQFESRPVMQFGQSQPGQAQSLNKPNSIYPTLSQRDPFEFPPQLPSSNSFSTTNSQLQNSADTSRGFSWQDNAEMAYPYRKKAAPPSRPPPPKMTSSRSNPNLNSLAAQLSGIDFSASATSPPPGALNEPYAIVKYPYREANTDELSCQPDDVVILKREVDDQWIYATNTRTGRSGIVPLLFLQVRVPLAPMSSGNGGGNSSGAPLYDLPLTDDFPPKRQQMYGQCVAARALYDYDTGVHGDLKFKKGDSIIVNSRVNEEWLRGEISGDQGIFPLNYVNFENTTDLQRLSDESKSQPSPPTSSSSQPSHFPSTVTAAFDYNSGVVGDLTFRAGDVIEVLQRHSDGQWITGRLGQTGEKGLVPLTYTHPPNF